MQCHFQDVVEAGPSLGEHEAGNIVSTAGGRPQRRDGIEERSTAAELILYDSRRGKLHVLNETAAAVWKLCDGKTHTSEIVARLEAGFRNLEGCDVAQDITSVLGALSRERLITDGNGVESLSNHGVERGAM